MLSLPLRERGLKSVLDFEEDGDYIVAPLAGAWIEMTKIPASTEGVDVAPLAGAWIEISIPIALTINAGVAPLAGAWIEISITDAIPFTINVAPLAGAWIEIWRRACVRPMIRSLPLRERGLK